MKRFICGLLCFLIVHSTAFVDDQGLEQIKKDTDNIWTTGSGVKDSTYTSLSMSMLGWGLGLAAGIAILASVLHQSTSSSHDHDHCD